MREARWLPVALWPVAIAAMATGYLLLLAGDADVTATAVIARTVGPSFIACGLIAWQRRPASRTGPLMALTGALYLAGQVLSDVDRSVAYTLGEIVATWWYVPFAALVLGFPGGRITSRVDRSIVAAFVFGGVVLQLLWVCTLPFPDGRENVVLVAADAGVADAIDTVQRAFNATTGLALAAVGITRWLRAAPPLRRLLLPTLAGSLAALIQVGQSYYRLVAGEWMRSSDELTAVTFVAVPLAFLFGLLRAQLARAGTADLVVALQRAPDARRLGPLLGEVLGDRSAELVFWLPGFERYVDADGRPVTLPEPGSGRTATAIEHDGEPVAALVHDAALSYEPELLEVVCAAADVGLERERLNAELESRVEELAGSRARLVEAGDAARRRIERDLHDGAQQRLIAIAIALRMTEDRIREDPETAAALVADARRELSDSLQELRELSHGIHPAALAHGLPIALGSLASRSPVPVSVSAELDERLPEAVELAAYFVASEGLANVAKHARATRAAIRVLCVDDQVTIEVSDDGIGGADAAQGSGLRGLADRVEAAGGRLHVRSPAGGGTVLAAELPCAVRPAAR